MHANVEDRGIKGDITPLMAAANGGHVKIVKLLLAHGADVNAQSSTGKEVLEPLGSWGLWHSGTLVRKFGSNSPQPSRAKCFLMVLPFKFSFLSETLKYCEDIQRWIRSVSSWKVFEYVGFVVAF